MRGRESSNQGNFITRTYPKLIARYVVWVIYGLWRHWMYIRVPSVSFTILIALTIQIIVSLLIGTLVFGSGWLIECNTCIIVTWHKSKKQLPNWLRSGNYIFLIKSPIVRVSMFLMWNVKLCGCYYARKLRNISLLWICNIN